jgi:hypothetical protein
VVARFASEVFLKQKAARSYKRLFREISCPEMTMASDACKACRKEHAASAKKAAKSAAKKIGSFARMLARKSRAMAKAAYHG